MDSTLLNYILMVIIILILSYMYKEIVLGKIDNVKTFVGRYIPTINVLYRS